MQTCDFFTFDFLTVHRRIIGGFISGKQHLEILSTTPTTSGWR